MIPYILVFCTSIFSALAYSYAKDISTRVFLKTALFLILFLPLALRYNIGTDYSSYSHILETAFNHNYMPGFEIGWYPIVAVIRVFNLDLQFFFIIPAFFSLVIFFHIVPRKKIWFCLPIYFCFSWINSFNIVRQAFSSVIFLLALNNYEKKNYFFTFLWSIVAICFHKSSVLLLALLLFSHYCKSIENLYLNIFLFLCILSVFIIGKIGPRLFDTVVGFTPYAVYLNSVFYQQTKLGSGIGVVLKEFILLLLLCSTKSIKSERFNKRNDVIRFFVFTMGVSIALSAQIRIFGRLANLFDAVYVFLIIQLSSSSLKFRKIALSLIFLITSLLFFKSVFDNPSSANSGLGVFPYQSIFSSF